MDDKFPDISILLHPQIPKPLHLLNPRTLLGQEWWDEQRQIAYAKHGYCCYACGAYKLLAEYHQWLEAHEFYNINYETGEVSLVCIVALCYACHNFIHSGRMQMLVAKGEMPESEYTAIMKRGSALLEMAGIKDNRERKLRKLHEQGKMCSWSDWHLVINGINYGQRFHSYEEWEKYWRKH